jgi:amidase
LSFGRLDALAQADLVRRGEVPATELVVAAIERIEAVNPRLNAVVTATFDRALDEARGPLPDSPLAGVPFLLKDLGAGIAGVRQTNGSRALRDHVATITSPIVERYQRAGLIIMGRVSTPEFGNHSTTEPVLFGPTLNPWDPSVTTGGSSGGSAAAVASGMVPAAHGSDGAGSIRIPSSCCGLFGLKPTRGRVSRSPHGEDIGGLYTEHALTRSVRDSAALLDVVAGPEPGDPYFATPPAKSYLEEVGADPGRLRIAWTAEPPLDVDVDPECAAAARETAALLASLGHEVEEARPEFDGEVLVDPLVTVWAVGNVEEADEVERRLGRSPERDELEITTWELVEFGRSRSAMDLVGAVAELGKAARRIGPFFDSYDAWITPTLARRPMPLGVLNRSYGGAAEWWRFDCTFNAWNPIANLTGQPAMSVPFHWTGDGVPIGTQVVGRYGDEAMLFRLAAQLEAARPWADRVPPVFAD